MATPADLALIRQANDKISAAAERDLRALLASLDMSRPEAARDVLLRAIPALVDRHGTTAAAVAAEWYDELRGAAGRRGRFRARPAAAVDLGEIERGVRYAAGGLFDESGGAVAGLLSVTVSKWVLGQGRRTISSNAGRDGARWARVPSRADSCAFCIFLASRGFAYTSEHKAERTTDGDSYHGKCRCEAVPDWSENPQLEGYDPDALYGLYKSAKDEAGGDARDILSAMREQHGLN